MHPYLDGDAVERAVCLDLLASTQLFILSFVLFIRLFIEVPSHTSRNTSLNCSKCPDEPWTTLHIQSSAFRDRSYTQLLRSLPTVDSPVQLAISAAQECGIDRRHISPYSHGQTPRCKHGNADTLMQWGRSGENVATWVASYGTSACKQNDGVSSAGRGSTPPRLRPPPALIIHKSPLILSSAGTVQRRMMQAYAPRGLRTPATAPLQMNTSSLLLWIRGAPVIWEVHRQMIDTIQPGISAILVPDKCPRRALGSSMTVTYIMQPPNPQSSELCAGSARLPCWT
ncbi:hypothetical protein GGR50DRAFT_511505 [Xylaria sp. CBS 124048]|nr:hypothetical protein GGR50DRAFT_511505 [Xylaria sp. CBS 124048]